MHRVLKNFPLKEAHLASVAPRAASCEYRE
jgi:hypothetical protein